MNSRLESLKLAVEFFGQLSPMSEKSAQKVVDTASVFMSFLDLEADNSAKAESVSEKNLSESSQVRQPRKRS